MPTRFAIYIEEPLFQFAVSPLTLPDDVGGWIAAIHEQKFLKTYRSCMKNKSGIKRKAFSPDTNSQFTDSKQSLTEEVDNISRNDSPELTSASMLEVTLTKPQDLEVLTFDGDVKSLLRLTQGVIINNIRVSNGRGGVTICRMAQAWVENSTFHDLSYGIRCLQNSKCNILNNKIYSCETTGIFMRDHSTGLIANNQIFSNGEAGELLRNIFLILCE